MRSLIGQATALALAEAGADIIGVSATLAPGSETEQAVKKLGRNFSGYACDFSNRKALYAFIETVKSEHATIDILVNNVARILRKPAAEHPDEMWDEVIEINLNAQFILSREMGKEMLARGRGKIIFTASLLTFLGRYHRARLCSKQGRHRSAHDGALQRVGGTRPAGQCHRSRLHRHPQHRCTPCRHPSQRRDIEPHPKWTLGRPDELKGPPFFSLRRLPIMSPALSCL
jgi:NAD(P)-dependent dehydrogenase (short-subunit alcohol dehydrogenase family)